MVTKHYPPEFKADAVVLCRSHPEAMIRQVATDLGVNPETLRNWVQAAGANRPKGCRTEGPAEPPTPLEAENAARRGNVCDLEEEREILRKAAKYFAGGDALVRSRQLSVTTTGLECCLRSQRSRLGGRRSCGVGGFVGAG
ncbi:transposase [Streptomyces stelliscabiei]|uniref:transposase n=1 Tax=Streptomyces stelliscabiei TaxID=146820 RepID=UPI003A8ECAB6